MVKWLRGMGLFGGSRITLGIVVLVAAGCAPEVRVAEPADRGGTGGVAEVSGDSDGAATSGPSGVGGQGAGVGGAGDEMECVHCMQAVVSGPFAPETMCAESLRKYEALFHCICLTCGGEGGPCESGCTSRDSPNPDCMECSQHAVTDTEGACKAEGDACITDS